MTRNLIRLTESDLHKVIKESVRIIVEGYFKKDFNGRNSYQRGRGQFYVKQKFELTPQFHFYRLGSGKENSTTIDFTDPDFNWKGVTYHFQDEKRRERIQDILDYLDNSIGNPVFSFEVNTGHPNGPEVHTITDEGVIVIQNIKTGRFVTLFAGSRYQVLRYWEEVGLPFPEEGDKDYYAFDDAVDGGERNDQCGIGQTYEQWMGR